jgi:hypothetical protein
MKTIMEQTNKDARSQTLVMKTEVVNAAKRLREMKAAA